MLKLSLVMWLGWPFKIWTIRHLNAIQNLNEFVIRALTEQLDNLIPKAHICFSAPSWYHFEDYGRKYLKFNGDLSTRKIWKPDHLQDIKYQIRYWNNHLISVQQVFEYQTIWQSEYQTSKVFGSSLYITTIGCLF